MIRYGRKIVFLIDKLACTGVKVKWLERAGHVREAQDMESGWEGK